MWWILGLTIWVACAVFTAYVYKVDWNCKFPGSGWDWDYLGWFALVGIAVWPITLMVIIAESRHKKEIFKIIFEPIGEWFNDHIDWRW